MTKLKPWHIHSFNLNFLAYSTIFQHPPSAINTGTRIQVASRLTTAYGRLGMSTVLHETLIKALDSLWIPRMSARQRLKQERNDEPETSPHAQQGLLNLLNEILTVDIRLSHG